MPSILPANLKTYRAWKFDHLLPGTFRRNKAEFAHHEYPILGPLPTEGRRTCALERSPNTGPYIYFVCDAKEMVRYVGKSLEEQVIHRWVRPGVGGPSKHYWTHSTRSGGCVFSIAKGLQNGESRFYTLRYVPISELTKVHLASLGISDPHGDHSGMTEHIERAMIRALDPDWNCR